MNKQLLIFLSLTIFTLLSSNAAIYKGQRVFVKKCLPCHKPGQNFVESQTKAGWEDLTSANGKLLIEIHLKSKSAKKSWSYFKSKKYSKKLKHLKQFLIEYAKDSGKVPAFD